MTRSQRIARVLEDYEAKMRQAFHASRVRIVEAAHRLGASDAEIEQALADFDDGLLDDLDDAFDEMRELACDAIVTPSPKLN